MNRDALKRELTEQFQKSLDEAMDAVQRAPDGAWISASEWQVREGFQKLTAQAFERIVQAKIDAAGPAAFSPCEPAQGAEQGNTGPARAVRRRRTAT